MSKLTLYAFAVSSCSWRVRSAIAYKGIQCDFKSVKDPRSKEYLEINPAGQIPVLHVDGEFIAESVSGTIVNNVAILEYLEDRFPEKPLLPTDLVHRAKVREIVELIVSGIQPLVSARIAAKYSDEPAKQLEWTQFYFNRGFTALEKVLSKTSTDGKFCFGNSFTTADCCLPAQVYSAVGRGQIDITPYPKIQSIYDHLMTLDPIKLGSPDYQL